MLPHKAHQPSFLLLLELLHEILNPLLCGTADFGEQFLIALHNFVEFVIHEFAQLGSTHSFDTFYQVAFLLAEAKLLQFVVLVVVLFLLVVLVTLHFTLVVHFINYYILLLSANINTSVSCGFY